ncbi:MAG: hypothetical protein ABH878_07920 [bacterium]
MRHVSMFCAGLALCLCWVVSAESTEYNLEQLLAFYDYDTSQALNPVETFVDSFQHFTQYHITFQSAHDETVTSYLFLPRPELFGPPPYPAILYLHGYGGDKEMDSLYIEVLGNLLWTLEQPYALMGLDAQYHGEREVPDRDMYSLNFVQDRGGLAQTIIDHRRAIDYLATRGDMDLSQIHVMGGSMGGILGGILIGAEPRIVAASLIVGGGDWTQLVALSALPPAYPMREALNHHYETLPRYFDPVDPMYLIGFAAGRGAVQMHNGIYDTIVPTGQILFDAAGEPKEIYWYPCGHDVGDYYEEILAHTLRWFSEY